MVVDDPAIVKTCVDDSISTTTVLQVHLNGRDYRVCRKPDNTLALSGNPCGGMDDNGVYWSDFTPAITRCENEDRYEMHFENMYLGENSNSQLELTATSSSPCTATTLKSLFEFSANQITVVNDGNHWTVYPDATTLTNTYRDDLAVNTQLVDFNWCFEADSGLRCPSLMCLQNCAEDVNTCMQCCHSNIGCDAIALDRFSNY